MTPRPRSRDKVVPVSIGIPVSLMMRLDNELDWKHSRSKWVKNAILAKLDAHNDESQIIAELESKRLLVLLLNRGVIDYALFTTLAKQVEETVTTQ